MTDTFNCVNQQSFTRKVVSNSTHHYNQGHPSECIVSGTVAAHAMDVLIDSGATHCMVGESFFTNVPHLRQNLTRLQRPVEAIAINGTTVTYGHDIEFILSFQGHDYVVNALYSPQVGYDIVLGLDFLRKYEIEFNFKTNDVRSQRKSKIKAKDDIVLPPNTEAVIWGETNTTESGDALVSNSDVMPQLNVFVASAIVRVNKTSRMIPVRVMNLNSTEKVIRKNTRLADLRLLTEDEQVRACASSSKFETPKQTVPKDFVDRFDFSNSVFDQQQKEKLLKLLWEYQDIFSAKESLLGQTDLMQFKVELKDDAVPFKARPYRSNPNVRQEIRRQVQEMLDKDIIEPSTSNFGSPVLLVSKPDGSYRFCIDYRKLNSMTKIDCHPIPRADDCIESLGASGAKYFSCLDLESGYWQMPVHPDSRKYTAFVTHDGLYQCKRMSFGLVNAPSVFTRLMTRVLQGLNWEVCLVYIDDVIIFSGSFEQHLQRIRLVFDRLRSAGLTLKPRKSFFGQKRIKFLGHYVSENGIEPMEEKCAAINSFPTPTKVKDIRSFLGLAGYYRRFIRDFSKISGPLVALTRQDTPFNWTKECENAFTTLKEKLMTPPILAYPNYTEPYILQTDASGESIGMILAQKQDDLERVIAYAGKRLSPNEKNYSTTEKEALAVIEGLKHFDPYLRGNQVTIVTDHSALVWLLAQKQPQGRIARWVAYLQQFNYKIEHKAGKKHLNADALSRRTYQEESNPDELVRDEDILPPLTANVAKAKRRGPKKARHTTRGQRPSYKYPDIDWTKDRVKECQQKDDSLKPIIAYLSNGVLPDSERLAREIASDGHNYVSEDGILYHVLDRKAKDPKATKQVEELHLCLVVPKELRYDVLTSVHGDLPGGHFGTQRTYTTMRLKYFWKGMYNDCKNWVISCIACNQRKDPVKPLKAELHPLPAVMTNERWAMDIVTLPRTIRGNRYVLTFTEYNTRYVEAFALPETSSKTIARVLVDEICFRYGAPQTLLSDLGANLVSEVMAETCKIMKIERLFTAPYRPQTDGLLEKFHHTMCKNLSMYVNERHDDWDLLLKGVCYSYNTTACVDSTQFSPYFLMFGREPLHPIDTILPSGKVFRNDVGETISKVQFAREAARDNIIQRQKLMKERYDKNSNDKRFNLGDLVWIHFPEVMVGGSRKFYFNWSGPYIIIEQTSDTNYRVAHAHNSEPLKNEIHLNRIKPFYHRSVLPPKPKDVMTDIEIGDVTDLNPNDRLVVVPPSMPSDVAAKKSPPTADNTEPVEMLQQLPQVSTSNPTTAEQDTEIKDVSLPVAQMILDKLSKDTVATTDSANEPPVVLPERREALQPPKASDIQPDEFEIKKIIKGRYTKDGSVEYLIDWKNYPPSGRTYEPLHHLNDAAKTYLETHKIPITGKKPKN